MPKTYVALDLETTGLDPMRDAIIEIGAARFDGDTILETYQTFVNPGRKIPPFITELTGITDDDVQHGPGIRSAAQELDRFVGNDTVVGHNIGFDLAFLRRQSVCQNNPAIDTFELAGILVPHAGRYSLANLVQELDLNLPEQTHRALDDVLMTHKLFIALMDRAAQLPQQTVRELIKLGQRVHWSPVQFLSDALYVRRRQGFSGGIGAQLREKMGGDAAGPLFHSDEDEMDFEPLVPSKTEKQVDLVALTAMMEPGGEISEIFPDYEYRDQQVEMMQSVAEALNTPNHLLVEAGTGTGKSIAYLLPAIEWAVLNGKRVVISTNTINLQEQLADKDIPQLANNLYDFRFQVLKGRSHYLCRQQFDSLRRRGPMTPDEMRVLAKVLLWLPNTLDGDGDGLFLPTPGERAVWQTISAGTEACSPERCRVYQAGQCYFYQARQRAENAHLVIVNHALLLADMITEGRVLPEYEVVIIDEAHHLENATTSSLQTDVNWFTLSRAFDDLLRDSRGYPSILDDILGRAQNLDRKQFVKLNELTVRAEGHADRLQGQLDPLFTDFEIFLQENSSKGSQYSQRLRVTKDVRKHTKWGNMRNVWAHIAPGYSELVGTLDKLAKGVDELSEVEVPELDAPKARLLAVSQTLANGYEQLGHFLGEPDPNKIYWMESGQRSPLTLTSVPLAVGPMLAEHIFAKKRTAILTSATLRIEGSFEYMRERLGVGEAEELKVGSPFDYQSAALLYVLKDIPEPNRAGYQGAVETTLLELCKATEGRTMALFTSYTQLRNTAQAITGKLARAGITVLAQGQGGSRAQLLDNFKNGDKTVLLGTRSFWEGVDVPGDALSVLVIVKLPFDVPDDPVIAARAELFENSFNDYMVPEAILRFTQGFGRLIRTASDQGIAVVMDGRLMTKRYGQRFIESLPDPLVHRGSCADLPRLAKQWLESGTLGGELDDPYSEEYWDVAPPEEPPDGDQDPDWYWGA